MGRSIICSKCKNEKEESVRNESYCKACKSERMKISKMNKRIHQGLPPTRPIRQAHCGDCVVKLESGEDIRGRCAECHRISQQLRVEANRVAEGLPAKTLRNSEFCHKCNIPKVNGRCVPCRQNAAAARRLKAREAKGLRPWGSGRPLTCYKCGNVKENPDAASCHACKREEDKRYWKEVLAPKLNRKEVTMICECGATKESTRKIYCNACIVVRKRDRTRLAAQVRRDKLKKDGFIVITPVLSPEEKAMRKGARDYLNRFIRQGIVQRQNCEICGSDKLVEAHHEDYGKPLEVRWLCRVHHDDEHHKQPLIGEKYVSK